MAWFIAYSLLFFFCRLICLLTNYPESFFTGELSPFTKLSRIFAPLRYVPNVAKRSIWDQCKKKYILRTDYRPTTSHLGKFQMAISQREIIRSTSCLVLRWDFLGRRIEWRYFRFRQIQDGGSAAILKNSNGDIIAADHPIYSVFGSRMGFSGSADRMALFPVWPNSIGMWEKQCARRN